MTRYATPAICYIISVGDRKVSTRRFRALARGYAMSAFLSKLPFWVDMAALIISIPVVLGGIIEAGTPFQVRVEKRKVSVKHRIGALAVVAAFLTAAIAAASGLSVPASSTEIRTHLTFVEPQQPPDGGPVSVPCHTSVIMRGYVPGGERPALASMQNGTSVFYFESAVTPGPQQHEWSGSMTLGKASSTDDKFTLYAIVVPQRWESYLVQAVNWNHRGFTNWADLSLPPHASIAASMVVRQANSKC